MPNSSSRDVELDPLLLERLTLTVQRLRIRMERHSVRRVRLRTTYHAVQRRSSSSGVQMDQQMNVLEGLLRAWMPRLLNPPDFAVVSDLSTIN